MDPRIDAVQVLLSHYRNGLRSTFGSVPARLHEVRPDDASWSVANVIEHLALTERQITGLLSAFIAKTERRANGEAFDRAAFERDIDMPFFLDRARKIKGSQPSGSITARDAWAMLEASRKDLLAALDTAHGLRLEDVERPHPATGKPLNGYQWLAFIALHEGRHTEQIAAIASSLQ